MASGSDFSELKGFLGDLKKFEQATEFPEKMIKQLAARLLRKLIRRTPVSEPVKKGKKTIRTGGTLRRGWTAKTEADAQSGGKPDVEAWIESIVVLRSGDTYQITIENPVHYGIYVEFGHRTPNGGWVDGQFMMTISENELRSEAPAIIDRELTKYLKEVFG